jgi:hypothetical protein
MWIVRPAVAILATAVFVVTIHFSTWLRHKQQEGKFEHRAAIETQCWIETTDDIGLYAVITSRTTCDSPRVLK